MSKVQKMPQAVRESTLQASVGESTSVALVNSHSSVNDANSSLDELGIKYNCDKSSVNRSTINSKVNSPGHDYLRKYEFFINQFRQKHDFRLLELGIGPDWNMGASLKIWLDYFTREDFHALIVDINPNAKKFEDTKVSIEIGNLGSTKFLDQLGESTFDLIVDDASHIWSHQIKAFESLFPSVSAGGVYIIEDTQTSFSNARKKWGVGCTLDAFQYLTKLSALVVGGGGYHPLIGETDKSSKITKFAKNIDSITFIRHSCIICKAGYYR